MDCWLGSILERKKECSCPLDLLLVVNEYSFESSSSAEVTGHRVPIEMP